MLAGTTRAWLVDHGGAVGLEMVQRDLRLEDLQSADELAVCSAIAGVVPVTRLEGRPIGTGKPGPWVAALREARERWVDELSLAGATPGRIARTHE